MINFTKIFNQVNSIKIKSVTDSLFRNGLLFGILGLISAIFKTESWVTIVLFSICGLFCIFGLSFFIYFSRKNADYLRSETFQLKKQSIELIGDKENQLNPNVKELVSITNPYSEETKSDFGE